MLEALARARPDAEPPLSAGPPLPPALPRRRTRRAGPLLGFLAWVLLPASLFAAYAWGVAADQYAVELRFAVRAAEPARSPLAAGLFPNLGSGATDAYAVVQHLQSREALLSVGRHADIRAILGSDRADPLARLDPSASLEQAMRSWRAHVRPYYDRASGIVSVELRAFAPEDALALAVGVERAAEALVNAMSERSRAGLLGAAEAELATAEARFARGREAVREFRERRHLLDPRRHAQGLGEHLVRLQGELIARNAELSRLRGAMTETAPQMMLLRGAIRSLEEQVAAVQARLTSQQAANGTDALAAAIDGYEAVETEAIFAQKAWEAAMAGLDRARVEAARQQIYLAPVVRPVLPEHAVYPARILDTATAFAALALAWFIGLIALRALREHLP
jgi:capsular polysaccharide transport system permease protein